jgi:hypothetical protein
MLEDGSVVLVGAGIVVVVPGGVVVGPGAVVVVPGAVVDPEDGADFFVGGSIFLRGGFATVVGTL